MDETPLTAPSLTQEQREAVEKGLLGPKIMCGIFVNNAARVTVHVELPESVSFEESESLGAVAALAANEVARAVDAIVPAREPVT